jgi:hypothetical protein
LDLPVEFATKGAILRHFAVSLWLNDPMVVQKAKAGDGGIVFVYL